MTNKPTLKRDLDAVAGLAALALFVVMTAVFVGATFGQPEGFEAGISITAGIGYAMFNITGGFVPVEGEGLLAAFLIIALVLDAALEGSIMLARRERDEDQPTSSERPNGGDD